MSSVLLATGLILLFLALTLLLLVWNERQYQRNRLVTERHNALGLPEGELVYEDIDGEGESLSSSEAPLIGKPDYIVRSPDGRLIPILRKLNVQDARTPQSNHVIQIAAYCLILEDYSEQPPTHGILRYADREFTIEYTTAIRKRVLRLLAEMEHYTEQQSPQLLKQSAAKCRACIFKPVCAVGQGK